MAPQPADIKEHAIRTGEAHSRWLSGRLAARTDLRAYLADTLDRPWTAAEMSADLAGAEDLGLGVALRRLRERVMARLIVRDLSGLADLDEAVRTCTTLAEICVCRALDRLHAELAATHGEPLDEQGRPQRLIVVGMGKLGGGELNVSSDIDLIFVYPEAGETAGPRHLDNHEFFTRLGKRLIALLDERTAEGFVFRVDMRLRPYGDSGPLVASLAMLENYFYTQAREWERYAWIKGRALTGDSESIAELEALRHPFVFRKYLDYGVFAAMRDLHEQIRREVQRRDRADNIKLGPGGIREIEFIAQAQQLVRGGREPALQIRPTRAVLTRLVERRLLEAPVAAALDDAYCFLRNLEHRLQYLDDAQTQDLPRNDADRTRIAASLGCADWDAFYARLGSLRAVVNQCFEATFGLNGEECSEHPLANLCDLPDEDARAKIAALGYADPGGVMALVCGFRESSRYHALPATNQAALDELLPYIVAAAAGLANRDTALTRMLTLIETISRRAPYLKLLSERPAILKQVAQLAGASPWAAQYLTRQPFLLDELIDERTLLAEPDWQEAAADLDSRLEGHAGDTELQMESLRQFKQTAVFRLLAQDLDGLLSVERLSDHLSALADLLVDRTLRLVWDSLPRKHRETPSFAVIAYGKLGGKELGYASDLDLVFLYDDAHPEAQETYARLAKKLISWLSAPTAAGLLYDTDLRLRPDGASGLLVSSIEAFDAYQHQNAWTWEHQALTRARFCCGDAAVGARFEAIRRAVLAAPRDRAKLREDVLAMRRKMHDGHPNPSGLFDLKHDCGGLVDVEFAVQFLILAEAGQHPELLANSGNIALLGRCAELALLPAAVALPAAGAYRELRRRQHEAKLQGADAARVEVESIATSRDAVRALWDTVFPERWD